MNDINNLSQINWSNLLITLCIIGFAFVTIVGLIEKISVIVGKPVKWVKQRTLDHDLLTKTAKEFDEFKKEDEEEYKKIHKEIDTLNEREKNDNNRIEKKIDDLADLVKDKSLEDSRWHILDMASAIGSGRVYSTEQLARALKTYDIYENLITQMGKKNGEAELSIEIIRNAYKKAIQKDTQNTDK